MYSSRSASHSHDRLIGVQPRHGVTEPAESFDKRRVGGEYHQFHALPQVPRDVVNARDYLGIVAVNQVRVGLVLDEEPGEVGAYRVV